MSHSDTRLPVVVDSLKSFAGQLCNPMACFCMSMRVEVLCRSNKFLSMGIRVVSIAILVIGLAVSSFREYLTFTYYGNEDVIFLLEFGTDH
jgi:hypothetical protein